MPIGKLILTMLLEADGCSMEQAIQDVHNAMPAFGRSIKTEDRDLEVLFVPDLKLPASFDDMLAFDSSMANSLKLLDISRQQAIKSGDDERAIIATMNQLKEQRRRIQEIVQDHLHSVKG